MTHQAAVMHEPGKLEIVRKPTPELAPGEARVRIRGAGVCGTDLAIFFGDYPVPLPLVLGHELVGDVVAVGPNTPDDLVGQRVTAEINNTCLARGKGSPCAACRRGLPSHCRTRTVLGIIHCDGAFAETVEVPVRNLHRLPEAVPDDVGVFVEPLAAAIQTFERSPLQGGELVVVLGVGRLGVLVTAVARTLGAEIIAVDGSEAHRSRALDFGAEAALAPDDLKLIEAFHSRTEGLGADVVVEATGSPEGLTEALRLVRPRGVIAVKSTSGLPAVDFDTTRLVVDEVQIHGSRCGPFLKAIKMLAAKQVEPEPLISAVFPLGETAAALHAAQTESKVLIRVGSDD